MVVEVVGVVVVDVVVVVVVVVAAFVVVVDLRGLRPHYAQHRRLRHRRLRRRRLRRRRRGPATTPLLPRIVLVVRVVVRTIG